jgi:hypothetical protein
MGSCVAVGAAAFVASGTAVSAVLGSTGAVVGAAGVQDANAVLATAMADIFKKLLRLETFPDILNLLFSSEYPTEFENYYENR